MLIIGNHPKKTSWKLVLVTEPGSTPHIQTGWVGDWVGDTWQARQAAERGCVVERIPNILFEAALRVVSYGRGRSAVMYTFEDKDDGRQYEAGGNATMEILQALQSGAMRMEDGWIVGRWTFQKQGNQIYLCVAD